MIGLFNVNKPRGVTSHDVVQEVRRLTGQRKVGHAGTLDPLASGVLLILVGRAATRLARFLMRSDKSYRAVIRLGEITPTYDTESPVVESHPVTVKRSEVVAALRRFVGEIEQIPPMYSALKKAGKPLYQLAREGKTVAREARPVTIYELELLTWSPPDLTVNVRCSAGTYIRSLAHDLGTALGCGAHLQALMRTASGTFTLEESQTLAELQALTAEGRLESALLPPRAAFAGHPHVQLTAAQTEDVRHGRALTLDTPFDVAHLPAHDPEGRLVAVLIPQGGRRWRPTLVLNRGV
ncbi:MAG: tRNA pseudouridine(55) synthase TruB [Anaerolineae bacterium]